MSIVAERGITRTEAEALDGLVGLVTPPEIAGPAWACQDTLRTPSLVAVRKLQAGN
jgi:hypothetical protein